MQYAILAALLTSMLALPPLLGAQQDVRTRRTATVQEARVVYETVERAIRQHQLTEHDTTVTCENGLEARGSAYRDSLGRIRRISTDGGTGDHGESVATYYDTVGRARFAFAQRGSVNGTAQEERVYFDARGTIIHRLVRQTRGPGYFFEKLTRVPRVGRWARDLGG